MTKFEREALPLSALVPRLTPRFCLQYHPDKNPEAGDIFVKISKAYEVLTNDATRENYEKCVALIAIARDSSSAP